MTPGIAMSLPPHWARAYQAAADAAGEGGSGMREAVANAYAESQKMRAEMAAEAGFRGEL